jgi:crossover junction endodeoxyribonuclease RusA
MEADSFQPFKITLPWPPSMNTYWRAVPMGNMARNILSRSGRLYRERAITAIKEAGAQEKVLSGRLSLGVMLCAPDRRLRDLDNFCKPILDALSHGKVYEDDFLIDKLRVVRGPIVPKGSVVVSFRPAGKTLMEIWG